MESKFDFYLQFQGLKNRMQKWRFEANFALYFDNQPQFCRCSKFFVTSKICIRFQLEKAILEKDNVVENLQRKVCGLQAEMRIVVKENNDLSKKIACLAENQKRSTSPYPDYSSPRPRSPFGSPKCCQKSG